jgi:hypothetical protein
MEESKGSCAVAAPRCNHYQFSSTHVMLPANLAGEVMAWGEKNIEDDDLFIDPDDSTFGREAKPHVTILYGLHVTDPDGVRSVVREVHSFPIRLGKITRFSDGPRFDVLKVEAESLELRRIHDAIKQTVPNTYKFPNYRPHVTVAYVVKGHCRRLDGSKTFCNFSFTADQIVFASYLGRKEVIPLG